MAFPGRTDEDEVKRILETDDEVELDAFIDAANDLVTELCTDDGYSDHRLKLIETWLAAHFYCVRDPRLVREEVSVIRAVYEGTTDLNLNVTKYGQQVLLLDTAGNFARLNENAKDPKNKKQSFKWLGGD